MNMNPCRTCSHIDEDKNTPICMNCDLRIKYVRDLDQQLDFSATCAEWQNSPTGSMPFTRSNLV